jgi:hypothetical protein
VEAHNVVRFARNGVVIGQNPSTTVHSTMSYTNAGGLVTVFADLSNAYSHNTSAIHSWTRDLEYSGNVLRVHDVCSVAADVQAVFQLHVPVLPAIQPDGSIVAGTLRIVPLQPVTVAIVAMADAEYSQGYRIELTATSGCGFDVELQGQ